jgi:hypothetical protein
LKQHLVNGIGPQTGRVVGVRIAAGNREHALREKLLKRRIDLACLPLVFQTTGQATDQSVTTLRRLQQDRSAIRTALPLIEMQYGGLGKNLRQQQTLCRGKVDHAGASPVTQTLS